MKKDHYILLVQKQLAGEITPAEQNSLERWLEASTENQQVAQYIQKAWALSEGFSRDIVLDMDADFQKIEHKLLADDPQNQVRVRPLLHRRWLLRIAAVFVLLATGSYIFEKYLTPGTKYQVASTSDKASEKPIELVDGSKIWLNEHTQLSYFTTSISKERRVKVEGEAFF